MWGRFLKTFLLVVSCFFASNALAGELLQNGGFESGLLAPWEQDDEAGTWSVTGMDAFEGAFSGLALGARPLDQWVTPTLGSEVSALSFAAMTAIPGYIRVEIHYNDDLGPTRVTLFVSEPLNWETFDITDSIDDTREVARIRLVGHNGGSSTEQRRSWFDALTLEGPGEEPPPEDPPCECETCEVCETCEICEPCEFEADEELEATAERVQVQLNLRKERAVVSVDLHTEELPEAIQEGPVEIRLLLTQDGFTTAFDATAEIVESRHSRRRHVLRSFDLKPRGWCNRR